MFHRVFIIIVSVADMFHSFTKFVSIHWVQKRQICVLLNPSFFGLFFSDGPDLQRIMVHMPVVYPSIYTEAEHPRELTSKLEAAVEGREKDVLQNCCFGSGE